MSRDDEADARDTMTYTERFTMHLKLSRGGSAYAHDILADGVVIGTRQTHRETRASKSVTVYTLNDGREFETAGDMIAAYEATKKSPPEGGDHQV